MRKKKKSLLKIIFILGIFIFVSSFYCFTILLTYFFWFAGYFENNQILDKHVAEFSNISHPRKTSLITSHYGVHRSPGNGNNCYYFLAQIRQFSGSTNDIEQFYAKQNIKIEFLEGDRFGKENKPFDSPPIPYGYHQLSTWKLSDPDLNKNLYLIFSLRVDFEKPENGDLRCH